MTDRLPTYMDLRRLSFELSCGESTIENWLRLGQFPVPRKVGGKRLWAWKEVERFLDATDNLPSTYQGEGIREATKRVSQGG